MNFGNELRYYGSAMVYDKLLKKEVSMDIYKSKSEAKTGMVMLRAVVENESGDLDYAGKVYYTKIAYNPRNNRYGPIHSTSSIENSSTPYGVNAEREEKASKIFVDIISTNYDRYGQVGTKLMQALYEISSKDKYGSEGRIQLNATKDAPVFYHQCNYKAQTIPDKFKRGLAKGNEVICDDVIQVDEILAKRKLEPNKGRGFDYGGIMMFLPRSIRENWIKSPDFKPVLAKKP